METESTTAASEEFQTFENFSDEEFSSEEFSGSEDDWARPDESKESVEQKEEKVISDQTNNFKLTDSIESVENKSQKTTDEVQPVLSDETKRGIFDVTNRAKIEEKRLDKVKKIFQSIETLVLSISDTYQVMNEIERKKIEEKISDIEKVIDKFRG
jgi:hypothetical protein